ncbi:hypothetical protein SeLEV6574_g08092 [Synchytrium endobioticum]|uniref:Uncharacterized protein n=1 Tax=Synchytrium endobioticum TaxID=286115 RepID=A0A507CDV2_9FUNG|nr:hypothetical protein SeLEV6574_g08092 [Synchytrium endobioticum]
MKWPLQQLFFENATNSEESSTLVLISAESREGSSLSRTSCTVRIIGKQIIRLLSEELVKRSDNERHSFYRLLGHWGGEAAVRWMMLQVKMHEVMSTSGLQLVAISLSDNSQVSISPTGKVIRFSKNDMAQKLKDNESGYFWPKASNHPSIDGFMWDKKTKCIILLQCTMSRVHPIKQKGLDDLQSAFQDAGLPKPNLTRLSHKE